jgi:DNA-binding NarL/FixJ family response regulator
MFCLLQKVGFNIDPRSSIKCIVDIPCGYALFMLEQMRQDKSNSIVVTCNTCPEYLLDLQDLTPKALLTSAFFHQKKDVIRSFCEILRMVAEGGMYHQCVEIQSKLSFCERLVLRYAVRGWKNKQISKHLGITEQTVRNYLRSIYSKLDIVNHSQAILYYWQLHYHKTIWYDEEKQE